MNITFNEIINNYFNYAEMRLKKTYYQEQKQKIIKHILPYFKNKNIYEIDVKDIIFWKMEIEKLDFKYNTKSYLYYALSSIFDYLVKYYNVKTNYVKIEGNFKNNDYGIKGNIWNINEFNQFIDSVEEIEYKTMFYILFFTGMRKGELLALTKKDIDLINNTININKTISKNHELQATKTKSSNRIIHINNKIKFLLKLILKNKKDNDLLFNISFTTLKRKKDFYCKKSGVKQIKIHEFRHSHACYLFQNKIEIEDISYRLGHSNISMTLNTYLRYLPRNEKRVIKLLNSIC